MPRALAPWLALLLACSTASVAVAAASEAEDEPERLAVVVGVPGFDSHPFWFNASGDWPGPPIAPEGGPGWTGTWQNVKGGGTFTGFMLPLLEWVCDKAHLDCQLLEMYSMPEMLEAVQNGTADFIGATLSKDAAYVDLVDYVQPYFYSAGVALYMQEGYGTMLAAAGGWEAMRGERLCAKPGTPQMKGLEREYGIETVWVDTTVEACAMAAEGINCTAFAFDSGRPLLCKGEGLVQAAGFPPIMTEPFALTVGKNSTALRQRLEAALLETMKDGTKSVILEWEKKYVSDQGALSNPELSRVVEAISYFQ